MEVLREQVDLADIPQIDDRETAQRRKKGRQRTEGPDPKDGRKNKNG